ncbi:hypothetical protein [Novosphingobium sp.]|uniref:hypothetical protein n=1 Tax=Novosphingobium sp. TaxID=1874826 RepID=UPI00286E5596|nr:hypothetical protein [Novosphingobium sp.]
MSEITVPDYDGLIIDGLSLLAPAQVNRSIWTGRRKVVGLAGTELWRGKLRFDDITTEQEERPWRAFLFGLRGPANWFRWYLPCNRHIGPMPTVAAGATAGAYTVPLAGMLANAIILRAGQFMTVPMPSGTYRAVCLMADLVADGTGEAVATFEPALPEAPTLGATVETGAPWIAFALTNPEQGFGFDGGVSTASFDVEESL